MKEVGSLWGIGGFAVEGGGMAGQEPRQAMASNPQRRSRDLLRGRGYDIHTLKVGGAHLPPPAREARGGGGRGRGGPRRGGGAGRGGGSEGGGGGGASSTIRRGCRWLPWRNRRVILVALAPRPATPH